MLEDISISLTLMTHLTLDTSYHSLKITSINWNIHSLTSLERVHLDLLMMIHQLRWLNSSLMMMLLTFHTTLTHLEPQQTTLLLVKDHLLTLFSLLTKVHLLLTEFLTMDWSLTSHFWLNQRNLTLLSVIMSSETHVPSILQPHSRRLDLLQPSNW